MNHRVLADRGLDGFVAERVEQGLVFITMPALGATGPDCAMPGFGMLTEGMGGFAARHGAPAEGARTSPTYYPDAVGGIHGTLAVLAGLCGRRPGGRGTAIDLSQQETLWLQFGEGVVLASREGRNPQRTGNIEPGCLASGVLATTDEDVAYVVPVPAAAAVDHIVAQEGRAGIEDWAAHRSARDVATVLRAAGAGTEPVKTIRALFDSGALEDRGMLEYVEHPVTGKRAHLGLPLCLDGDVLRATGPAPRFDEHTDDVLTQWLDLPADAISRLRADRTVGTVPGFTSPPRPAQE